MLLYLPRLSTFLASVLVLTASFVMLIAYLLPELPDSLTPYIFKQSIQQKTAQGRANYRHFLQNIGRPEYRSSIECSVDNWGPGEMLLTPDENFTMLQFRNSKVPILLIFPKRSGPTGMADSPSEFCDLMERYHIPMLTAFW
ncbi:MAG: hypothetical protein QG574_762 [Cyanobacteriota bacterium erpe_2018_sw_21hr_WHONDRS-SW48-000092_B_bin.40]|jgi:hypothetical protein|nr:hypothetical protein [Cyanobacteriota bacterium erpe_2018_sw_21hr_WHONDRS-SW48-000092_B_bin.40]